MSSSFQSRGLIKLNEALLLVNRRGGNCGIKGTPEIEDGKVIWEFFSELRLCIIRIKWT